MIGTYIHHVEQSHAKRKAQRHHHHQSTYPLFCTRFTFYWPNPITQSIFCVHCHLFTVISRSSLHEPYYSTCCATVFCWSLIFLKSCYYIGAATCVTFSGDVCFGELGGFGHIEKSNGQIHKGERRLVMDFHASNHGVTTKQVRIEYRLLHTIIISSLTCYVP